MYIPEDNYMYCQLKDFSKLSLALVQVCVPVKNYAKN